MVRVTLPGGDPAPCTPENISELFEQKPAIMGELIRKTFFDSESEAPASGNLESSAPGNAETGPGSAETAETKPTGGE